MEKCQSCPLLKVGLDIECASSKHARYCVLAEKNDKYHNKIMEESVSDHNKKIKEEGLPLISWDSVKRFGKEMFQWAKSGESIVPEEVQRERLSICQECESLLNGRCSLCGCFVESKTKIPTSECPIKKWLAHKETPKGGGCSCSKK